MIGGIYDRLVNLAKWVIAIVIAIVVIGGTVVFIVSVSGCTVELHGHWHAAPSQAAVMDLKPSDPEVVVEVE